MNPIYDTFHPSGFSTVNTYIFTANPQALIEFYQKAFYAEEYSRTINEENGEIRNAILKIGHSSIMISQARGQFYAMRTSFYLFVNDVDSLFENAVQHGAEAVFPPDDMDYGDRQGGVIDPAGNYWWISKRLVEGDYES